MSDDGVINLCVAIVKAACDEYRDLWKNRNKGYFFEIEMNKVQRRELEKFFRSEWFEILSFDILDPDTIMRILKI
jgi:hypothetical protein